MSEPIVGFSKFVEMVQTFHYVYKLLLYRKWGTREDIETWAGDQRTTLAVVGESMTTRIWGPMQDDVGGSERYWAPKLYIQQGIIWGLVPRASYFDHESTVNLSENWIG